MKKRIVSFLMALVMAVSLLPVQAFAEAVDAAAEPLAAEQQETKQEETPEGSSAQGEAIAQEPVQEDVPVLLADAAPKYVVTSNIELATDKTDTQKPYLASGAKWIADGTVIDYEKSQALQIDNYPSIAETSQLDYIEVDGLKIYYSDFERCTSATVINTDSCANLNGRTVKIRLNSGKPMIAFMQKSGTAITKNIEIKIVFKLQESKADYQLNATAGENGKIYKCEYLHPTDDGKSVYGFWIRPDDGYQWLSYTMEGTEIPVELKNRNYTGWALSEPNESGDTEDVCNYFEITIEKNSDITLNFAPATVELNLIAYMPIDTSFPYYTLFGITPDLDYTLNYLGYKTSPLVENSGAKFCYTLNINGFIAVKRGTDYDDWFSFKIYNGAEADDDALLFDIDDPNAVKETDGLVAPQGQFADKLVYTGYFSNWGYAVIMKCPELKQITTEATAYGKTVTVTSDVKMSSDVPAVKEFTDYYTATYGLDKLGAEAYTAAEKQTEGYKLYCQYSTFRYVLRKVYQEQALKIAASSDPAAALETAKQALAAAARGEGCNAVSWSFIYNDDAGTHSKPTLVAIPNDGDDINKTGTCASDAICAALEAEYPGNWTYTCTSSQFGMFVNMVTAGGEDDTGRMMIRSGTNGPGGSYGFWYYNGKFSEWGVSNYYPYDGDVMAWGNPDVAQSWALAILRYHYKNIGGDAALEKAMAAKGVSFTSSGEALEAAFPDINFSRYGQFRAVSKVERVIQAINTIGEVSPDSEEAIQTARAAYEALSDADKESVTNYQQLLDAEAAFRALSQSTGVDYQNALSAVLTGLNATKNTGIGSTNGAWLTLALARGGMIRGTDTEGPAVRFLSALTGSLGDDYNKNLTQPTDYARVALASTALGVAVPEKVLAELRDYDKTTAQGVNAVAYALLALDSMPYDSGNTAVRDKYVQYLLDNACNGGGWVYGGDKTADADVDMTAMVLQALAAYYDRGAVKTAVDKGLAALKTMQKSTGGFASFGAYNAESTAQVIVALTALGIDPKSEEWTKENGDPIEALLHFYNADTAKFRHSANGLDDQMATEQSAYALVAYNRFKTGQNRLYDMRDAFGESGAVLDPAQAVKAAKLAIGAMGTQQVTMKLVNTKDAAKRYVEALLQSVGVSGVTYSVEITYLKEAVAGVSAENPYGTGGKFTAVVTITSTEGAVNDTVNIQGQIKATPYEAPKPDVTVSFQLLGDTHHKIETDADIHTYRFNADELPVWIDTVEVTVPGGSTVGDVFKKVMDYYDFTYVGLTEGYISAIGLPENKDSLTAKDDSRGESGWMYLVNGKHPNVGLNAYELTGGEVITWHWCDDYTIEEGSEKWSGSRVKEYIENLIKLVGEVDASDTCKARIDQARSAYNKLTEAEKNTIKTTQTLVDAEAKYKNLIGMDSIADLIGKQTWTVAMSEANDAAAVKTWLEAKLNALDLNGATATATVTDLTAATAGTADNKGGTAGSFTFDVTLTVGEGGAQASRSLTGLTGTITAAAYVKSANAGVSGLVVAGETATISGNSFTVTVPYGTTITAESFKITLADSKASITTLPHEENGVWSFTVTAEDGTAVTYTVTVTVGKNPEQDKVDTVIGLINGIGTIDKNSKDKIDAARKAYNALSEEQKALVPASVLQTLTDAEAAYAKLTGCTTPGGNTGKPGNTGSKPSTGSDAKKDDGKTVKSGNTGDAGIVLYVGIGFVTVLAGAVVVTRKRKEN